MLRTLDGKLISRVPHAEQFTSVLRQLGEDRAREVRTDLHRIVDELPPNKGTGRRIFSSSYLGSDLSPWQYPLAHLYDVAWEIEGPNATDEHVENQAALMFGLFVWECIMNREEEWRFYDPNLSSSDPNREVTGKHYFEPDS